MLRERKGIMIKVIPMLPDGTLDMSVYQQLLTARTKLVAVTGMSNALGIIPPINKIIGMAHHVGAKVMIDASQLIYHAPINVRDLNCDFMVFTGHKCYGPTGIGVLYGKTNFLNELPPFLGGGDMIETVAFDKITYAAPPRRFEAGTPPIAEAVGLAAAIDFMNEIGMQNIAEHDSALHAALKLELQNTPRVKIHGSAASAGIISFTVDGAHPQDIATLLDKHHIAVRVGHHCCMPLMQRLGTTATIRASFGVYNTLEDVKTFTAALQQCLELLH